VAKTKRAARTPPVLTPDDDDDVEPARGKPRPTKDDDEDDYFGDDPPKGPKRPAAPTGQGARRVLQAAGQRGPQEVLAERGVRRVGVAVAGDRHPVPGLAFEYVIAQDCFPLGLVLQLVAAHGIGKSALLAEFGRWFDLAGGGGIVAENETKFNPFWYSQIMGRRCSTGCSCTGASRWRTGSGT
jgi:hypothetical protein